MSNLNNILRDSKILIDGAKDTIISNIIEANRTNIVDLNEDQLQKICNLVSISLDESFQKSLNVFSNMVKRHIGQ